MAPPVEVRDFLGTPNCTRNQMISTHELSMRYGKDAGAVEVLRGVSIEVATGERVAIVGPSGCGKTTLLLLLAGLDRPSGGSVAIAGTPLETLNADHLADLRRDQLGIVFQAFHLVPSLSALENVALPLEIAGRTGARERARDLLDRGGLSARDPLSISTIWR